MKSDSADGSSRGYDGSQATLFIGESDSGLTVHNRGAAMGTSFILARITADYYERRSENACQAWRHQKFISYGNWGPEIRYPGQAAARKPNSILMQQHDWSADSYNIENISSRTGFQL